MVKYLAAMMRQGLDIKNDPPAKGRAKILIIEDEIPLAMMMTALLTRAGFDAEVATTGAKAMQIAQEKKFDLITLDIDLPDASGFQIYTELKQRYISWKVPIIFISGRSCAEDIQRGLDLGAADYVTKPFDPKDFIQRLLSHIKIGSDGA